MVLYGCLFVGEGRVQLLRVRHVSFCQKGSPLDSQEVCVVVFVWGCNYTLINASSRCWSPLVEANERLTAVAREGPRDLRATALNLNATRSDYFSLQSDAFEK